jgi:two-component system phosphate regulon response regulator PhoB
LRPTTLKTILVVDDELDMQIYLANVLRSEGFHPITAEDPTNGYRQALAKKPVVIILNMMMPSETGIQMYRRLKRDENLRDIPVIMLATLDKNTFLKCHNLYGYPHCESYALVDKFMQKPIEAAELLKTVTRFSVHAQGPPAGESHV